MQIKKPCGVVNGSQTVTVAGDLTQRIKKNQYFLVEGELVPYTIAADSTYAAGFTTVALTGAYQGATNPNAAGVFVVDVTYPDNIPTISQGDVGTAAIFSKAMYRLQDMIKAVNPDGFAKHEQNYNDVVAMRDQVEDDLNAVTILEASAHDSQVAAAGSATAAATSATNAKTSETRSKTSETNAKTSETNAKTSETNSKTSETNASTSAATAQKWATQTTAEVVAGQGYGAKKYANDASASAISASTSATNAKTSETNSKTSETNAATSAGTATTKAGEAAASATAAATSAGTASTKADEAAASSTAAATSKTGADTAKTAAETAKTAAETAKTAAETARTTAQQWATNTATTVDGTSYGAKKYANDAAASATAAATSATNAATSKTGADTAKTAAETAKTAAETAKTAAETAKTAAETAKTAAQTSATNAKTSETNAAGSATAAANSASALQAALAEFRQTFLGRLTADPTVDGNGGPLADGMEYFNTVDDTMRVYHTGAWHDYDESAQAETTRANLAATNAATSAAAAATSATNASDSATAAATSASNAATSASNANTSKTSAATSATNAKTSETNAKTSETNAKTSETNAAASAQVASDAADRAVAGQVQADWNTTDATAKSFILNKPDVMLAANIKMGFAEYIPGIGGASLVELPHGGTALSELYAYRFELGLKGTSGQVGAVYTLRKTSTANATDWELVQVTGNVGGSNPEMRMSADGLGVEVFHSSSTTNYTIRVQIQAKHLSAKVAAASVFGLEGYITAAGGIPSIGGNKIWHAGNGGAGSGLDADLVGGAAPDTASTANTIVKRDGSRNINANYFVSSYVSMSHAQTTRNADTIFYSSTDNYVRKNTAAGFKSSLALDLVENKSSATIRGELTAANVETALGYSATRRATGFPAAGYSSVIAETSTLRSIANPSTGLGYAGGVRFRFGFANDASGQYADIIDLSTYTDSSGGGYNSLYFNKQTQQILHKWGAAGATAWTTKTVAYTDSNITGTAANVTGTVAVANGGTGATTAADARTNLGLGNVENKSAATINSEMTAAQVKTSLGYTPVQQGTGVSQTGNAVKIGWSAASKLRLTVDSTDFGEVWPMGVSGNAGTATKLATARTINGVSFDGSANITVADSTKLPLAGGQMTGTLNVKAAPMVTALTEINNSYGPPIDLPITQITTTNALAYAPVLRQRTQLSTDGYIQHIGFGAFRYGNGAGWSGGAFIGVGESDTSMTSAYHFSSGGALTWNGDGRTFIHSGNYSDYAMPKTQTTIGRVGTAGVGYGSYGSINVAGQAGGYAGISFSDFNMTLMMNGTYSGVYRNNTTWDWRWDNGTLAVGTVPAARISGAVAQAVQMTGWKTYTQDNNGWYYTSQSGAGIYNAAHAVGLMADSTTGWKVTDGGTGSKQMTASQFNGSGAGLTGYAGSLKAGDTNSIAGAVWNGYTWTAAQTFLLNRGSNTYSDQLGYGVQFQSTDSGHAGFTFHRAGYYAVNMGLDPDGGIGIGGISAGAGARKFVLMTTNGDFYAAGNVIAYSDERLKTDWQDVPADFIERWAEIKHGTYRRVDDQMRQQVGVGAQSVQKILPAAVFYARDGELALNYGGSAAVATVQLAKRAVEQEQKIAAQASEIANLKETLAEVIKIVSALEKA